MPCRSSTKRLKVYRAEQMVVQVCAFVLGLLMLWWESLRGERRSLWMTVAVVLILWSVARLFMFLFPVIFLIANLGQAAILYVGGRQIITGLLTLGAWQEFSLYLVYLFFPIAQLGFIITQFGQAAASADRSSRSMCSRSRNTDPCLP